MEKVIQEKYNQYYNSIKFKIILLIILICPIAVYALTLNYLILYANLIMIHLTALVVAIKRYLLKDIEKQLDMEIALAITVVDMITRFFCPVIVTTINNSIIFSFIFLFIYRQTRLSIRENISFLIGYSVFYFLLNLKFLDLLECRITGTIYSVILSVVFAYALLATYKVKNIYRRAFCGGITLLCMFLFGKRVVGSLNNTFVLAQALITVMNVFTFFYWYEDKRYFICNDGTSLKIKVLTNLLGWLAFLYYLSGIKVNNSTTIWAIAAALLLWYVISIFNYFEPVAINTENEKPHEKLTGKQLYRLGKYARHLEAFNLHRNDR